MRKTKAKKSKYQKVVKQVQLFHLNSKLFKYEGADLSSAVSANINELRLSFLEKELEHVHSLGGWHSVAMFVISR